MTSTLPRFEIGDQALYGQAIVQITGWSGSANHTPAALGHTCRHGDACGRFDIAAVDGSQVPWFAWACQLKPRIPEGGQLDAVAGDQVVRVRCVRPDRAYVVELGRYWSAAPGEPPLETVESFASEVEARAYARDLTVGLREAARLTSAPAPASVPAVPSLREAYGPRTSPVVARPPARGRWSAMSRPQAEAIVYALRVPNQDGELGVLGRGQGDGRLSVAQLRALAKRGMAEPMERAGRRGPEIVGARVTSWGERRAAEVLGIAVA